MPYDSEFPALARATNNMEQRLMRHVAQNLSLYSVEVRIDYERWVQYSKEYRDWARKQDSEDDRFKDIWGQNER